MPRVLFILEIFLLKMLVSRVNASGILLLKVLMPEILELEFFILGMLFLLEVNLPRVLIILEVHMPRVFVLEIFESEMLESEML